jgi:hypothetical protein
MENKNDKSSHILNASSNLLGICFIVITSLQVLKLSNGTIIDEISVGAIVLFMTSVILSFLSIRRNNRSGNVLELIAEYCFIGGISLLFITTLLFSFKIIH